MASTVSEMLLEVDGENSQLQHFDRRASERFSEDDS